MSTTMKKRLTWLAAGIMVFICTFYVTRIVTRDRVTLENFLLIRMDMTKSEIHWLLGGLLRHPSKIERRPNDLVRETWSGSRAAVLLWYDRDEKLVWLQWDDSHPQITWFDRLIGVQSVRE